MSRLISMEREMSTGHPSINTCTARDRIGSEKQHRTQNVELGTICGLPSKRDCTSFSWGLFTS